MFFFFCLCSFAFFPFLLFVRASLSLWFVFFFENFYGSNVNSFTYILFSIFCPHSESISSDTPACRNVTLKRGTNGFGFSIVGGHGSPHGNLPIYVKTVFEDSCNNVLHRGDQIIAVDGVRLEGLTHQEAVLILKNADDIVTLTILWPDWRRK